jgi:hypothetical protein
MAQPREWVEAPPVTPLPYGLLSAALVLDDLNGHAQMGVQYEPEACGVAEITRSACEEQAAAFTESTDGIPVIEGDPFTLYHLFTCRPVGVDLQARAESSLRLGEQRGLEVAVAERLALAPGSVDLTEGVAVHPVTGLGILEKFAGQFYGGVPTIHMPRHAGTDLAAYGAIQRSSNGARLETVQGALVASGGGYYELSGPPTDVEDPDTIQAAADGFAWMYVTGQVVVRRASQVESIPLTLPHGTGSGVTNDAMVLATRAYVATWECITAAVLVQVNRGTAALDGGGA